MNELVALYDWNNKEKVIECLKVFEEKYEKVKSFQNEFLIEDKQKVIKEMIPLYKKSFQEKDHYFLKLILSTLLIISRDRTGLDELYENENLIELFKIWWCKDIEIAHSAAIVLSNLCVLNRLKVIDFICQDEYVGNVVQAFNDAMKGDDRKHSFISCRILFLLSIDNKISNLMSRNHDIHNILIDKVNVICKNTEFYKEDKHGIRRILSELMKIIFNLTMSPNLPKMDSSVSVEKYDVFAECVCQILSINCELPNFDEEEKKYKDKLDMREPIDDTKRQEIDVENENENPFHQMKRCNPARPDIDYVKSDTANILINQYETLIPYLERNPLSIYGLCKLFDRHAHMPKRELGTYLTPIALALTEVIKKSKIAKTMLKRYIFKHLANPLPNNNDNVQVPSEQQKMRPEGTEKELASDNILKYTLISCLTTVDFATKGAVEELLWQLSDENSKEYIRLCGFGNAAGLLVNRGLPGFAHLKSAAIDLDALMANGKKL